MFTHIDESCPNTPDSHDNKRLDETMKRIPKPRPGTILGVIAVVIALTGTAVASGQLTLSNFTSQSRDTLAGTGVIQYAQQTFTTGGMSNAAPQTFMVNCELSKKATAGGFKWATPPNPNSYNYLDGHPTGGGYQVRIYVTGQDAVGKQLTVNANCVKSRAQRGTPLP